MAMKLTAEELLNLLSGPDQQVYDADDAAKLLSIERGSIEYAAYRKRIPYVQYGAKKLFTRADLENYASNRGRGRESKLEEVRPLIAK